MNVGLGVPRVGVGVGLDVGDGVAPGSSPDGVWFGERVGVGGGTIVLGAQNSVMTGSSPATRDISRHVGMVSVFVSISQVTAPSSTARWVVSPFTSILINEGTLKRVTGQAFVTNSYEGFWAKNRRLPSCTITCSLGKVRGFRNSTVVSGASSRVLPSPRKSFAPSVASEMIRPLSEMATLDLPSMAVHSDSSDHCTFAFPAYRCISR